MATFMFNIVHPLQIEQNINYIIETTIGKKRTFFKSAFLLNTIDFGWWLANNVFRGWGSSRVNNLCPHQLFMKSQLQS